MPNVLVTGGAGYIGSHCVYDLIKSGSDVSVIDNLSNSKYETLELIEKATSKKINFYEEDLKNAEKLESIFSENSFNAVIHLAADKSVNKSLGDPLGFYTNNIISTLNLLKCMKNLNTRKLIFSSSATVYSPHNSMPLREDNSIIEPINPYGKSKLMIETILNDFCKAEKNFSVGVLRYFNPIGAHESGIIGEDPIINGGNLAPALINALRTKNKIFNIYGNDYDTQDGTCIRDFIHIMDLSDGHLKALNYVNNNIGYNCWNLGTGKGFSVLEVIENFQEITNEKLNIVFQERRDGDVAISYACADKALNELNWKTERDLPSMLSDLYNWSKLKSQNHD